MYGKLNHYVIISSAQNNVGHNPDNSYTEYLNKFLFIQTNCPDRKEPVKILLAMVVEALRRVW